MRKTARACANSYNTCACPGRASAAPKVTAIVITRERDRDPGAIRGRSKQPLGPGSSFRSRCALASLARDTLANTSRELALQQPLGIAAENLAPFAFGNVELADAVDGGCDRAERRVRREHDAVTAEEFKPAAHGMGAAAKQRGIAIEVVQIVEVRPLQ